MKSIKEIMASWTKEDWDRIAKDFGKKMKAEREEHTAFYKSEKCEHIISRILAANRGLDCDAPHYHYDEIVKDFGFEDVSLDDFSLFFNVMSSESIGKEDISDAGTDETNPWGNCHHVKRGLWVSVMVGQGTSIYIKPACK